MSLELRTALVSVVLLAISGGCSTASGVTVEPALETSSTTVADNTTSGATVVTASNRATTSQPPPTTATPGASDSPLVETTTSGAGPPESSAPPSPASELATSTIAEPRPCTPLDDYVTTPSQRRVLARFRGVGPRSPLVIIIHGYTGTPTGIERYAEFTNTANRAGIAVAYPEGTPTGRGGFGWSTGAGLFATTGVDDVAALAEMLDILISTGCVDPDNITLTGESNGAGMVLAAACAPELAGRFRSVVMVIPSVDTGVVARCSGDPEPVPLTAVAGRLDRTVPYDGGRDPLLAQEAWFAATAGDLNRCVDVDGPERLDGIVERLIGRDCAACTEMLVIADGTHTWPGTSQGVGGLVPGSFDLNSRLLTMANSTTGGCLGEF